MPIVISGTNGISGVDGTASNPSYEGTDANTGVFFPAADTVAIGTNGTEALRVNSSQNVGVGVTPSAWGSNYKVLSANTRGLTFAGGVDSGAITVNAYYDTVWRFAGTSSFKSARYDFYDGAHYWFSGNSGTAGNAITFAQVMQVDGGKSLALEGATSQTGTGITFPATQSASSNANTLDDYEEGTWTPTLTSTGATFTYSAATGGQYVKVGSWVVLHGVITLTNRTGGTTGNALFFSNLPFAPGNDDFGGAGTGIIFSSITGGVTLPANQSMWNAVVRSGTSVLPYYSPTNGVGINRVFQYGDISTTAQFQFSLTYRTT